MTQRAAHQDAVARVRAMCAPLERALEHDAWTGASWRIGRCTFAHVLEIVDGRPPAYARAFATIGPATVLTFQCASDERAALAHAGPPFHLPAWRPGIVGVTIDQDTDWAHIGELIAESHAICLRS
jgi:hypothetical protein